ncbi:UDP-glycosyltransferase 88F5-like [Telopea speciosissima]|uniref:UDP-glycosyltransferase 88F5-like n=1 Tax=Telopea speciosissima TaxID=54955 RepID=UPI001CC56FDC|nr:UDP-glycosyltransferase 88F5-like [Telopea speciosissima]
MSEEQLTKFEFGLERSGKRFLWVVRPPAGKDGAFFTALGGGTDGNDELSRYLPDEFLIRTQEVGLVVPMWAPQVEVLSHPSIGGFLRITLWVELDAGKHSERSADDRVAAVRGAEDECSDGGGGSRGGGEDEGLANEEGGEKRRDREAGEIGDGKEGGRGSSTEKKNERSEGEWVESGRGGWVSSGLALSCCAAVEDWLC